MTERWIRFDDPWEVGAAPYMTTFPVVRFTRKCAVLNVWGVHKFVLMDAKKRYAYPTEELALASYIIRKKRQMQHASATLRNAEANLMAAEKFARGEAIAPRDPFAFCDAPA